VAPTDPIDHFLTSLSVLIPQLLREVRATLLEVLKKTPFSWAFGTVTRVPVKHPKNRQKYHPRISAERIFVQFSG